MLFESYFSFGVTTLPINCVLSQLSLSLSLSLPPSPPPPPFLLTSLLLPHLGILALSINCRSMLHATTGRCFSGTASGALFGLPSVLRMSTISCKEDSQCLGSPMRTIAETMEHALKKEWMLVVMKSGNDTWYCHQSFGCQWSIAEMLCNVLTPPPEHKIERLEYVLRLRLRLPDYKPSLSSRLIGSGPKFF